MGRFSLDTQVILSLFLGDYKWVTLSNLLTFSANRVNSLFWKKNAEEISKSGTFFVFFKSSNYRKTVFYEDSLVSETMSSWL